jgi:hypothetical protein
MRPRDILRTTHREAGADRDPGRLSGGVNYRRRICRPASATIRKNAMALAAAWTSVGYVIDDCASSTPPASCSRQAQQQECSCLSSDRMSASRSRAPVPSSVAAAGANYPEGKPYPQSRPTDRRAGRRSGSARWGCGKGRLTRGPRARPTTRAWRRAPRTGSWREGYYRRGAALIAQVVHAMRALHEADGTIGASA